MKISTIRNRQDTEDTFLFTVVNRDILLDRVLYAWWITEQSYKSSAFATKQLLALLELLVEEMLASGFNLDDIEVDANYNNSDEVFASLHSLFLASIRSVKAKQRTKIYLIEEIR